MSNKIVDLLKVSTSDRDLGWLTAALQAAVELELSTLPPYLCGLWSIKGSSGVAYGLVEQVVFDEMLHMGFACNLLVALGLSPRVVDGFKENISYPGNLPGGVRPQLTVYLSGLSREYVKNVYMEIEYPEDGPIALFLGESYPTIGAFYDAISAAFGQVKPKLSLDRQLTATFPENALTTVHDWQEAQGVIAEIKQQGEGTNVSPFGPNSSTELAHYYRYAELFHGKTLINVSGEWRYDQPAIPFPDTYPMAPVPAGGYTNTSSDVQGKLATFNAAFSSLLQQLESAWSEPGGQSKLDDGAVPQMLALKRLATALMEITIPGTLGAAYGPDFRIPMTS